MRSTSYIATFLVAFFFLPEVSAQTGVSINSTGTGPDANAILDVSSTDKGVLLPRVTTAQRTAMAPTAASDFGMLVYDTDFDSFWYWDGAAWQEIPNVANTGNTLDEAYDEGGPGAGRVINATNGNVEITGPGFLTVASNVGIGTTGPDRRMKISGTGWTALEVENTDNQDAAIELTSQSVSNYVFTDNTGFLGMESATGQPIVFRTNGANERVVVQSDGRLRVNSLADANSAVVISNTSGVLNKVPLTGNSTDVLLGTGAFGPASAFDDHDWYQALSTNTPTNINDWIYTNGRVGIGTGSGTNPSAPLHVVAAGAGNPDQNAILATNPNNSAGQDAIVTARVAGAAAGDPFFSLDISGEAGWSIGIDNDHANRLKIAPSWNNLSSSTSMTIQTDGNVGIGTDTPDAKLNIGTATGPSLMLTREDANTNVGEVLGSLLFDSTDDTGPSTNDASAGIRAYASENHGNSNKGADLSFFTKPNGTLLSAPAIERVRVAANGNIGVGTSSPAAKIHVAAGANDGMLLGNYNDQLGWNGVGTAPQLAIRFAGYRDVVGNFAGAKIAAVRTNLCCSGLSQGMELAFYTQETTATGSGDSNLAERLRIGNGGNIGVGTATPAQKLHVVGGGRFTDLSGSGDRMVYANATGDLIASSSGANPNSLIDGSGAANRVSYWADGNTLTSNPEFLYSTTGNLSVLNAESSVGEVRLGAAWNRPGVYSSTELQLFSDQTGIIFGDSDIERMRLTAAGNLGVGTASPAEALHVNGSLRVEDGQLNTGIDNLRLMEGVRADDNSYEWVGFYSGNTRQGIILYDGQWGGANNLTNEFSLTAENGNLLTLNTSGNHIALMPDGSGNVGVGTTAPDRKLSVAGNIYASTTIEAAANGTWYLRGGDDHELRDVNVANTLGIWGRQNSDRAGIQLGSDGSYIFGDNGNIGVGTTDPIYRIHSAGDIYADGGWFRVSGNQGLYFQSHGTGIHSVQSDGGQYGSVSTYGNIGGWEGYSIDGRYVLMAQDNGQDVGLYNDVDNYWYFLINRLATDNGYRFFNSYSGALNMRIQHTNGGNYASYDGDNNWDFYSDRRLKENIENETNILNRLVKLDVVNYDFIDQGLTDTQKEKGFENVRRKEKEIGFIAQDVEKYFPSIVSETTDDRYDFKVKALGYSSFGVLAVGGLKELKIEKDSDIAAINKKLAALEAEVLESQQIRELKEEVKALKALVNELLNNHK